MAQTPIRATDPEARLLARALLRGTQAGALATLDGTGKPFCSLVSVATYGEGSPVILVSRLSGHTRHLLADGRASLLLARQGKGDPLAHPRLTLEVTAEAIAHDTVLHLQTRSRFLRRHPKAALYVDFPDFLFFVLKVQGASLNGGFGRAYALLPSDMLSDAKAAAEILAIEEGAVAHMNEDHKDAITAIVAAQGRPKSGRWRMTGLDPDGADFAFGEDALRLPFDPPVTNGADLRQRLATMTSQARATMADGTAQPRDS
jgi:heme iron utilization protein